MICKRCEQEFLKRPNLDGDYYCPDCEEKFSKEAYRDGFRDALELSHQTAGWALAQAKLEALEKELES